MHRGGGGGKGSDVRSRACDPRPDQANARLTLPLGCAIQARRTKWSDTWRREAAPPRGPDLAFEKRPGRDLARAMLESVRMAWRRCLPYHTRGETIQCALITASGWMREI
ncbi:hypothetical protein GCM10020219_042220 [Nonomuraea dietziae]